MIVFCIHGDDIIIIVVISLVWVIMFLARFPALYKADTACGVLNTDILCTQCYHILQTVGLNKHMPRVTGACYLAQTFYPYIPLSLTKVLASG